MHRSTRRALGLTFAPTLILFACCSGSQEAGNGSVSDCAEIAGSASAIEEAAACHAQYDASACRDALDQLAGAGPAGATAITRCVLESGERSDGIWLADAIASVDSTETLVALGNQFGDSFDVGVHGITFSASLDDEASVSFGGVLGDLEPAARAVIVSLALSYRMDPLSEYAAPFAEDIDEDDPGVRVYAEQLAESGGPFDEAERRVLITSGVWTADEVLDCFSGEQPGCENWEGESPLEVLADEEEIDIGAGPAPNMALRLIRSDDITPEAVTALARIIGGAPYANRAAIMGSMMLDMTDSTFPRERRQAIARAATEAMCTYDMLESYLLRAPTSDPDRFDDPEAPWPTFVQLCAERHWSPDDLVSALSAGSWLGVPRDVYAAFRTQLEEGAEDLSCDEYHAMGIVAYDRTPWILMRGTAHVVVANLAGERCDALMGSYIEDVADSGDEHPEARLAAIEWLLERGDDDRCSRIDSILDWHHEGYRTGPGEWAEALGAELEERCD